MILYPPSALPGASGASPQDRAGAWQPGCAPTGGACRHAEIFAPVGEGSGAAVALALALDGRRAAFPERDGDPQDDLAWLWVQDRAAQRLSGRPYLHGLPSTLRHRLIHVAAPTPEDALFALEEGVRCRDLAFVLGEIVGNPRALDFTASRRLSLAAVKHGVPLWLVRLEAARDLGAARLRWQVRSAPSPRPRWNPRAPGLAAWDAELFRAHVWQPGQWVLREAEGRLVAQTKESAPASTSSVRADGRRKPHPPLALSLSKAAR